MHFYEIATLREGKTQAAFRTFMSKSDYITQDLTASKIKWKTASFENMNNCCLWDVSWNKEKEDLEYTSKVFIYSARDQNTIEEFFKVLRTEWQGDTYYYSVQYDIHVPVGYDGIVVFAMNWANTLTNPTNDDGSIIVYLEDFQKDTLAFRMK